MSDIVERLKGLANEARVSAEGSMAFSLLNDSSTTMNTAAAEITDLRDEVEPLRDGIAEIAKGGVEYWRIMEIVRALSPPQADEHATLCACNGGNKLPNMDVCGECL